MPRYTEQELRSAVENAQTLSDVLRSIGLVPAGGNFSSLRRTLKRLDVSTEHFTGYSWSAGKTLGPKKPLESYLKKGVYVSSHTLRKRLIAEGIKEHRCEKCLLIEWLGKPIPLELEHKDGDHQNNEISNLEVLCPNCHAFTPTYRGRNKAKPKVNRTICPECGGEKYPTAKICRKCKHKDQQLPVKKLDRYKVPHPSAEELRELIAVMPMVEIARNFGVSGTSIRAWADGYGITFRKERLPKKEKKIKFVRTIVDGKTWCYVHKDLVPIGNFTKNSADRLGLHGSCRDCRKTEYGRSKKIASLVD
jgi:ribosomal protein L40E